MLHEEGGLPFRGPSSVGGPRLWGLALWFVSFSVSGRYCFAHTAKQSDPQHLGYDSIKFPGNVLMTW